MDSNEIISLAQKHADRTGNTSAQLALQDAKSCLERGLDEYARGRALTSLGHSIGILHPDYQRARMVL